MTTKIPQLFTYANAETGINMTIDLAEVRLLAKRPIGGGYYLNVGGCGSIPIPEDVGDALQPVLLAFAEVVIRAERR